MICANFSETKKGCKGTWVESTNFCSRFGTLSVCESLNEGYGCTLHLSNITTEEECNAKVSGDCSLGGVYCRPKNFTECYYPYYNSPDGCIYETLSPYACDFYEGNWLDRTKRASCEADSLCYRLGTGQFFPGEMCDGNCPDGQRVHGVFYSYSNPWYHQVINKSKNYMTCLYL